MSEKERSDLIELIEAAAEVLQRDLAHIDMAGRPAPPGLMQLLVLRFERIKIRMDGNGNHRHPHVHVDYGKEWRTASYSIDTGERLAGNLDTFYDKKVREFVNRTEKELRTLWSRINSGQNTDDILCELQSSF